MSSLIEILTSATLMITIAAFGALLTLSSIFFDDSSKRRNKAKSRFLEILKGNIEKGIFLDLEVISHIKQSVEREFSTELATSNSLQDILVSINDPDKEMSVEEREKLNNQIKQLILDENKSAPFENLPEEERRLLRGLEDAIKNSDGASIQFHFDELNTVLSVRHVEHSKAVKMNRWSVPLAFAGLALTVIFGVMGMQSMQKEDMESIIEKSIRAQMETANKANPADAPKARAAD